MDETIIAVCNKCKQPFTMSISLYNHRKAHKSKINCPDCLMRSKTERYRKSANTHKKIWASYSDSDRSHRVQKAVAGIHAMDDEAKARRSRNSSIATHNVMISLSPEQRKLRSKRIFDAGKRRYANMTDEERHALGIKISKGQRSIPADRRRQINERRSESLKRYIQNLSPEELDERRQRVQLWWDTLSKDDYDTWCKSCRYHYADYIKSLGSAPNKNENAFIRYLQVYGIPYEFQAMNETIHPEFDNIFPMNPVTGSTWVSPYHIWDFKAITKRSKIYIDIDGSIHASPSYTVIHPNTKIEYSILDYYRFKDSQRAYQADELEAYAVLCYDDSLTDNTVVMNIRTKTCMPLYAFMALLKLENMDHDEIKKYNTNL